MSTSRDIYDTTAVKDFAYPDVRSSEALGGGDDGDSVSGLNLSLSMYSLTGRTSATDFRSLYGVTAGQSTIRVINEAMLG